MGTHSDIPDEVIAAILRQREEREFETNYWQEHDRLIIEYAENPSPELAMKICDADVTFSKLNSDPAPMDKPASALTAWLAGEDTPEYATYKAAMQVLNDAQRVLKHVTMPRVAAVRKFEEYLDAKQDKAAQDTGDK